MQKIPSDIAVGSDLELFLFDNEKEKIVPCVGILEGTKDKPYQPKGYSNGFAIQEDNVMVEFNIPPQTSADGFIKAINKGRNMVLGELYERHGSKYSLYSTKHVHRFRASELASQQAQTIGCEGDFDAYEGGKMRVDPPAPGFTRSCGGHIHLGGDFKCPDFVAALFAELFIGVRAQLFIAADDPRAKWYGKPGIYRPKPYGIEYRTPHNGWVNDSYQMSSVASGAYRCARYLTTTDTVSIQAAFRKIPWLKVRELMYEGGSTDKGQTLWHEVIRTAKEQGVPA